MKKIIFLPIIFLLIITASYFPITSYKEDKYFPLTSYEEDDKITRVNDNVVLASTTPQTVCICSEKERAKIVSDDCSSYPTGGVCSHVAACNVLVVDDQGQTHVEPRQCEEFTGFQCTCAPTKIILVHNGPTLYCVLGYGGCALTYGSQNACTSAQCSYDCYLDPQHTLPAIGNPYFGWCGATPT